jgi:hypothetical protein
LEQKLSVRSGPISNVEISTTTSSKVTRVIGRSFSMVEKASLFDDHTHSAAGQPLRSNSMVDILPPINHPTPSVTGIIPPIVAATSSSGGGGGGSVGGFHHQHSSPQLLTSPTVAVVSGTVGGLIAGHPVAYWSELEDSLADALFRRAQAKLLCDASLRNIENALSDALRVCMHAH